MKTIKVAGRNLRLKGSGRVLYDVTWRNGARGYVFRDAVRGIRYWFGDDDKMIHIAVFPPHPGPATRPSAHP